MSSQNNPVSWLFMLGRTLLVAINIILLLWSVLNFASNSTPLWPWFFVLIVWIVALIIIDEKFGFKYGRLALMSNVFCALALLASGSTLTSSWGYDGTWVKDGQSTRQGKVLFGLAFISPITYVPVEEDFSAPNIFIDIDPTKFSYGKYRFTFTGTIKQLPNVSNEQIIAAATVKKYGHMDSFIAEQLLPEIETILAETGIEGVLRLRASRINTSFQPPADSQLMIALAKLGYTCNRVDIEFKSKDW